MHQMCTQACRVATNQPTPKHISSTGTPKHISSTGTPKLIFALFTKTYFQKALNHQNLNGFVYKPVHMTSKYMLLTRTYVLLSTIYLFPRRAPKLISAHLAQGMVIHQNLFLLYMIWSKSALYVPFEPQYEPVNERYNYSLTA